MKLSGEFLYADDHTESFKGDETEAINRFMVFPWEAQLREAELLKKCSPTISIEYPEKARVLWASVIEKDKEPEFLVHFEDSASDTISESDGIALSALPNLIRLFITATSTRLRTTSTNLCKRLARRDRNWSSDCSRSNSSQFSEPSDMVISIRDMCLLPSACTRF